MTTTTKGEIVLRQLSKTYGAQTVVDRVTLTIPAGQFFSLIGPSGSGKTSTLMMLAGFAVPDEGKIFVDGQDMTFASPQQRGLGMVFQNYALFPHLSVFDNVAFPLKVRRMPAAELKARVEWALEVTRLSDFAKRSPKALSGGQQQRVALARAIVFHPQVVLMDEPLGALDKNLRYRMQVEIKEIQTRLGMTVVYVTHDQEEAMNMSDQIAIMNQGRIEQVGAPRDVYENPGSVFVAQFLGEANLLHRVEGTAQNGGNLLFLRPERVDLTAANDASAATLAGDRVRLPGTVRRVSYLGSLVRYGVDVGEPELLAVDCRNAGDDRIFLDGEAVTVSWRRQDGRMLAANGHAGHA